MLNGRNTLLGHSHTCEKRQLASSCLSLRSFCPSVCWACSGRIFFKFDIWDFL